MPKSYSPIRILGIDPGIERLGWAVVEKNAQRETKRIDSGVKKTLKSKEHQVRLLEIYQFLSGLIKNKKPDLVCVEKIFFSKNTKTALTIAEVRGVVLLAAADNRIAIKELTPSELKLAIAGYGLAKKDQVGYVITQELSLPQKHLGDDEIDALALALYGTYGK